MSPSTYPINSIFSVVVPIYKNHVFDEAFFLLALLLLFLLVLLSLLLLLLFCIFTTICFHVAQRI